MRVFFKFLIIFFVGINFISKACTPSMIPALISQAVISQSLTLNFQTNTTYTCPHVVEVEIACGTKPFLSIPCALFISPVFTATAAVANYPTFGINIMGFCPGPYRFRYRIKNTSPNTAIGPWSGTFNFSIPGPFIPAQAFITSSTPNLCPPQSTTLTANVLIDCGFCPYTYSWSPSGGPNGVSCVTCSNPIISPTVTTTYTVIITGGQLGCWTQSATITIPIGPIPPVIGPANAFPPSTCNGSTTIVGLAFYNGNITWQQSSGPTGPWTTMSGLNSFNFQTNTLSVQNYYYRALVVGCFLFDSSNVVSVTVNPNPTITVNSTIICPGNTATITASGASSYLWSTGAFPNGANTGGAAPLSTTPYTVTGVTAGCTATALTTVSVDIIPVAVVNDQTVCANQNLTLTAGGGLTYQWKGPLNFLSNQQSPIINNALSINSGPYTVTAISIAGCTNSIVSNITILPTITPTLLVSDPVCFGTPTSFTASGAQSYSLTGPNSFNSFVNNPVINNTTYAETGFYTLIGVVGSCSGTTTNFINVMVPPNPSATNSSPVCDGLPVMFTAAGAATYTWSGPSGFFSINQNPTISNMFLNNAGSYTLSGTGTNNCVAKVITNIIVNPLPAIPANNFTICLNSPINLLSGGGSIYSWKGPLGYTNAFQNPVIANAAFSLSGSYNVTVTTAAGCSNTAVSNVTVVNVPSPTITGSSTVCLGSNLVLLGSGGNTYTWTTPNFASNNQQNPLFNNIGLSSSGNFSLTTQVGNCFGSITKSITVIDQPVFAINTTTVCDARSLSLSSSNGVNYEWFPPNGLNSQSQIYNVPIVSAANAGTYTLITTAVTGCIRVSSFFLSILPNPTVAVTGATVCAGLPAVLTSTGGVSYLWTGPGFSSNTASAFIPVVNATTEGNYVITVAGVNSCTNSATAKIGMLALPEPSIIATSSLCFNSVIRLQGFGAVLYVWDGPFKFTTSGQTATFVANSMGLSGTYTLNATNVAGCVARVTKDITVFAIPEGTLNSDNQKHCVPFCSEFSFVNKNNTALLSNNWIINGQSYNSAAFKYCFSEKGDYVVFGRFGDANGCANTTSFVINAHETPLADFLYAPEFPAETADEVVFENNSVGVNNSKFSWSFIDNLGIKSSGENLSYYFNEAGVYPVSYIVSNVWGCADTVVKAITVSEDFTVFVPNSFTPNDDGKNETLQPQGRGVVKYNLMIYSRWGEKLFETDDFSQGWDGTFRGKACKEETYQWKIKAVNKNGKVKDLHGHVTLYR